jgi:hypothetical protein
VFSPWNKTIMIPRSGVWSAMIAVGVWGGMTAVPVSAHDMPSGDRPQFYVVDPCSDDAHPAIAFRDEQSPPAGGQKAEDADIGDADDEKAPSLDIVIAEHVLLWDGEIMTWEQIVDRFRAIRMRQGKPIHPKFHITNSAFGSGRWKKHQDEIFTIYKELFQPVGYSMGSISPRAGGRYDAIRTPADLVPAPELVRTGVVRSASGRPAWRATVLLVPEEALLPVMLRPEMSLTDPMALRDPLDEVWTTTDKEGRFRIASPGEGFRLAVISPQGFALVPVPKSGEPAEITLLPRSAIEVISVDKGPQTLIVNVHHPDLPNSSSGFAIYGSAIGEKSATIQLPPGRVRVSRSFEIGNGVSRSIPAERFILKAGETKALLLAAPERATIPAKE